MSSELGYWRPRQSAADDIADVLVRTLLGVAEKTSWMDRASCAETDPEAFFPERGGDVRSAKRVCRGCPVRAECLEYALGHDVRFGVWGGLSERARRQRKRGLAA